jgi:predicted unusual protein kinase regulating ubiquinone biosynthesis (AarF/ABC1/UbiB family)
MEYISGYSLDELNISDFEKQQIVILINLFCKNNYLFLNYFHPDLHDSNWKVRKYNDFFQIIIYDFGYIIFNNNQKFYKDLIYYSDINNMNKIGEVLYNSISNNKISECDFISDFVNFMNKNNAYQSIIFNIKNLYKYCYYNNYILNPNILEIFISLLLVKKYMDKYIFISKSSFSVNHIVKMNIYYLNICKKYNIFHDLQNFINETYVNSKELSNYLKYDNIYFNSINNSDNNDNNNKNDSIINIDI